MGLEIGSGGLSVAWISQNSVGCFYNASGRLLSECENNDQFNEIRGVSTDSRDINAGDIFIAIRGERFDGHSYIKTAFEKGTYCAVCEYIPVLADGESYPDGALFYLVGDTVKLLADVAHGYRKNHLMPLVAVTGSVGKTTTKQFIYYVLKRRYRTLKTEGNLNNLIGLPMTVLRADEKTEAAVVEMGMSALGEISQMSRAAIPDVAVLTNIGTSHIGLLGSREAIRDAKIEILDGLKDGGTVVYNGDEPLLKDISDCGNFNFCDVSFTDRSCYCYIDNIREYQDRHQNGTRKTVFDIYLSGVPIFDIEIPVIGRHNVFDAAVAYIVGRLFKIDDIEIRAGLSDFENTGFRQRIFSYNGITVIEDCYNASPESMAASLRVLSSSSFCTHDGSLRRIAVLGDMRELGDKSEELHKDVGRMVSKAGVELLYTVGDEARAIADGASETDAERLKIFSYGNPGEEEYLKIASEIKRELKSGDVVLFKASRAIQLEKVVSLIFDRS